MSSSSSAPSLPLAFHQQQLYGIGIALAALGCISICFTFNYISGALAIGSGALLCDTFLSMARLEAKLAKRTGGCAAPLGVNSGDRGCCAPFHLPAMLIATMVFAAIDSMWAIITSIDDVGAMLAPTNKFTYGLCNPHLGINTRLFCTPAYIRGVRYLATMIIMAAIFAPVVFGLSWWALVVFNRACASLAQLRIKSFWLSQDVVSPSGSGSYTQQQLFFAPTQQVAYMVAGVAMPQQQQYAAYAVPQQQQLQQQVAPYYPSVVPLQAGEAYPTAYPVPYALPPPPPPQPFPMYAVNAVQQQQWQHPQQQWQQQQQQPQYVQQQWTQQPLQ